MIDTLANHLFKNIHEIKKWFGDWESKIPLPFYSSVDIRDSGFKIAPVDCNLYPAGFNNICDKDLRAASPIVAEHFATLEKRLGKKFEKILLVPEYNTRNKFYTENLFSLKKILQTSGYEVRLGVFQPEPLTFSLDSGPNSSEPIEAKVIQTKDKRIGLEGFAPDLVILNNDFSGGIPAELTNLEQPVIPPPKLGWHTRRKNRFFEHYNKLAASFSDALGIDPWQIQVETRLVAPVNFNKEEGLDSVATQVKEVLESTRDQYQKRNLSQKPFVFIKNNSGTYGMGVMVVESEDEMSHLNRRTKNKMSSGKNRSPIEGVIVQEGIPTATLVNRLPSEPVIYLVGTRLIGGFLRTNTQKSAQENLNSAGMVFKRLCMADLQEQIDDQPNPENPRKLPAHALELTYGTIAKLCGLAAGLETQELLALKGKDQ